MLQEAGIPNFNFLPLATTGDDGILQINQEVCNQLFSVEIGRRTPGLCVVSLILDPDRNNSSLMREMILHLLNDTGKLTVSDEEFKEKFHEDLGYLNLQQFDAPTLIAWGEPIWVEKGSSSLIPVYILEIIGEFEDGFEDPRFISLAGLSLAMSSSAVTIFDEQEITIPLMHDLVPLVVQGLRSGEMDRFQQLHILSLYANSGPYGNQSSELLQEFWTNAVDNIEVSRLRTAFSKFDYHIIPNKTKSTEMLRKVYLAKFYGSIFDTNLQLKLFQHGAPMNGKDILNLVKKHCELVTDSEYKNCLDNFTKVGNITRESGTETNIWRDTEASGDIESPHHSDKESVDSDIESTDVECNTPSVDDVIASLTKLNLANCIPTNEQMAGPPRKKFSERYQMIDDSPKEKTQLEVKDKTIQTSLSNLMTNESVIFSGEASSQREDPKENEIPLVEDSIKKMYCSGKYFLIGEIITEEVVVEEGVEQIDDKARRLVEICDDKPEQERVNKIASEFYNAVIEIINATSADSEVSAEDLFKNAVENFTKNDATDPIRADLNNLMPQVMLEIETLVDSVVKFQDEVEENFVDMTPQKVTKISENILSSFPFTPFLPSLKLKLHDLEDKYNEIIQENLAAGQKFMEDAIVHILAKQQSNLEARFQNMRKKDLDITKEKNDLKLSMVETIGQLQELISMEQIAEFQQKLESEVETILSKEVEKIKKKWSSKGMPTFDDALVNKDKISLGIHFGLNRVAMNYWDTDSSSSKSIFPPHHNILSYIDGEFKIGQEGHIHNVNSGKIFVSHPILRLLPTEKELFGTSIMLVTLIRLKQIAEAHTMKQVANCVVVIPSFISSKSYDGLTQFSSLLGIKISIIGETEAVAAQLFGEVGLSNPRSPITYKPTAIIVIVLRKRSYDIAGFTTNMGQIVRHGLECYKVSNNIGSRVYNWAASFFNDKFIVKFKSVVSSLPSVLKSSFQTILLSDTRDMIPIDIESKLQALSPCGLTGGQLLSNCACKGASLLAAIESGNVSAQNQWQKAQAFDAPNDIGTLFYPNSNFVSDVNGWWSPSADEEVESVIKQVSYVLTTMDRKNKQAKKSCSE